MYILSQIHEKNRSYSIYLNDSDGFRTFYSLNDRFNTLLLNISVVIVLFISFMDFSQTNIEQFQK